MEQENLRPLTLPFFPVFALLSFLPSAAPLLSPEQPSLHAIAPVPSPPLPPTVSPLPSALAVGLALFRCQSSRRIDDDSLEEQIRQTSEDSRALRELMEGERGKLRQSLEELQRLHSQVRPPSSVHAGTVHVSPDSFGTLECFLLPGLYEKWVSSDRVLGDSNLKLR